MINSRVLIVLTVFEKHILLLITVCTPKNNLYRLLMYKKKCILVGLSKGRTFYSIKPVTFSKNKVLASS